MRNSAHSETGRDICFLMDPYATLNLDTETSLLIMDELISRGHRVYWLEQQDIALEQSVVTGLVSRVCRTTPVSHCKPERRHLDCFDALVIRKDPPFDELYLHLTYVLDFLSSTAVINSPAALRNFNEKLATLRWASDCPATLVTMNVALLLEFVRQHGRVVLKPLDDCSGRNVTFVDALDEALEVRLRQYANRSGGPQLVLAQAYLPGVKQGDKRVYLVDGEPVGWVNRIPAPGSDLANIHQGARSEETTLSERERALSQEVGARLREAGILLAGLDFIDGWLTEINITSPSAVRQINAVSDTHLETRIVDAILSAIDHYSDKPRPFGQTERPLEVR